MLSQHIPTLLQLLELNKGSTRYWTMILVSVTVNNSFITCVDIFVDGVGKYLMVSKFAFIADEFSGKRALVTGGTAGIGKAVVCRLLDGGATVMTTARETQSNLENHKYEFIQADLSTSDGCTKVVNEVISRFGGIDILVNVVGASSAPSGGFSMLSDEEWQKELNINLMAAVRLDRGLLPRMVQRGSGVIIHVHLDSEQGFLSMKRHWRTLPQKQR